jgi:hypothetical protein
MGWHDGNQIRPQGSKQASTHEWMGTDQQTRTAELSPFFWALAIQRGGLTSLSLLDSQP